jgi:quercetin dioxygenase-like cupin family protein
MMNRREAGKILALAAGALITGPASALAENSPEAQTQAPAAASSGDSIQADDLMREPLAKMADPEVTMLTLTLAPGATSHPHRHTGPVFAYILEGSVENQVDPGSAKTYKRGDFFYEPPMHVHRQLKNLSATDQAKILVVEVGEKGEVFTISA